MIDLSVTIGGVYFPCMLSNAAGTVKTIEQARKVARSASGCVRSGSFMFDDRPGNSGRVFWEPEGKWCSFNSLGIPGPGFSALKILVPQMADVAHAHGKPLVFSLAGKSPEECGHMAIFLDYGADRLDVNAGCPNLYFEGTQKPILSYHPVSMKETLQEVCKTVGESRMCLVDVKVSPYFYDPDFFSMYGITITLPPPPPEIFYQTVEVIKQSGVHIVAINTVPNAFFVAEDGKPAINSPEVPNGCGGLAGPLIKELAREEGRRWREALPKGIMVVAAGGIEKGADMRSCLGGYADAVQVGTAFYRNGDARVFERIMSEYIDCLSAAD